MTKKCDMVRHEGMQHYGFGIDVMKATKVCKHCGAMTDSRYKYCLECGEQLPKESLFEKYKQQHLCCDVCQTIVSDNTLYCPSCGRKFKGGIGYECKTTF